MRGSSRRGSIVGKGGFGIRSGILLGENGVFEVASVNFKWRWRKISGLRSFVRCFGRGIRCFFSFWEN